MSAVARPSELVSLPIVYAISADLKDRMADLDPVSHVEHRPEDASGVDLSAVRRTEIVERHPASFKKDGCVSPRHELVVQPDVVLFAAP